jgi:hypothetical protein
VGETVLATQNDRASFVERKRFERASEIMAESWVNGLRIMFGLQLSFIDANEFLPFTRFFAETIVGDAVKPGRKTRFAAKAAQILVSAQKGFLRQIVCQGDIRPDQIAEQTPDGGLMIPDQFRKSVVVVIDKDTCNEVSIG